jgi:hypothetical protein
VSRRQARHFHQSTQHKYRMELVLEFGERVSGRQASEAARRILESVQVATPEAAAAGGVQKCQLLCHELRQIVPLIPPRDSRE